MDFIIFTGKNYTYNLFYFYSAFFFIMASSYLFIEYCYINKQSIIVYHKELSLLYLIIIFTFQLLIFSTDLFLIYFIIEISSFLLYLIFGYLCVSTRFQYEGVIKYYIINSLASIFLIFSVALLYLITLETQIISVTLYLLNNLSNLNYLVIISILIFLSAFFFKLAIFPCFAWLADLYDNLPLSIILFLMTFYKFVFLLIFIKVLFVVFFMFYFIWAPVVFIAAILSIIIGSFFALIQYKLKRFLAYTSVSQLGYILLGLSCGTMEGIITAINFFMIYLLTTTLFFYYLHFFSQYTSVIYLTDLLGKSRTSNFSLFSFVLIIMSWAQLPPLLPFFTKYFIISYIYFRYNNYYIIIILLSISLISMYYYLRLIKINLFELNVRKLTFSPKISYLINFLIDEVTYYYSKSWIIMQNGYLNIFFFKTKKINERFELSRIYQNFLNGEIISIWYYFKLNQLNYLDCTRLSAITCIFILNFFILNLLIGPLFYIITF
jgi:NADH-quinone oxidoreductase subunit N